MSDNTRLQQIRENERKSHIAMYSDSELYQEGSWLRKPIKTVLDLLPYFESKDDVRVLDLGCGVGRNCISIAKHLQNIPCCIDCVDILDLAIIKLKDYAEKYGVSESIHGIVSPIEGFLIPKNHYDWILAVSSLEHIDSEGSFIKKLSEIRDGLRSNGIVTLVINSDVREYETATNTAVPAQFEVNLPTVKLLELLENTFAGWSILKSTVRQQHYEIPRECGICELHTSVVSFAARKS